MEKSASLSQNTEKHYEGVFRSKKKNGEIYYRASLTHLRKHISLGSYTHASDAHRAYLEGSLILSNPSISLLQYRNTSSLSYEKWVCLINFRDNKIYFSTPIYVKQKMFNYYLSPTHVLKFDLDDLFYFSSHKIMCRGNHYFVADYGMQINIASRYDIKNYAVPGKDFQFINGDVTDFRRENILIINTFHGVSSTVKEKRKMYCAKIHLNGNYIIGYYDTELEAAIAYNKAIDLLRKNGIKKKYSPNYIDTISPSKYADIYANLSISDKITSYKI